MMRWGCRRYQPWIVDHADRVLAEPARQRLERHLTQCAACRADLEALQHLPHTLSASAVPDPGDAFWLQQRQAIGRTIRNLPPPHADWHLEWLRDLIHVSPWRYPIAATVGLVVALSVYRIADRPASPPTGAITAQLAALDNEVLAALGDLADTVTLSDDPFSYTPQDDEVAFAVVGAGDLVGSRPLSHVPSETDLSDTELDGVDDLIGSVG